MLASPAATNHRDLPMEILALRFVGTPSKKEGLCVRARARTCVRACVIFPVSWGHHRERRSCVCVCARFPFRGDITERGDPVCVYARGRTCVCVCASQSFSAALVSTPAPQSKRLHCDTLSWIYPHTLSLFLPPPPSLPLSFPPEPKYPTATLHLTCVCVCARARTQSLSLSPPHALSLPPSLSPLHPPTPFFLSLPPLSPPLSLPYSLQFYLPTTHLVDT
jgi:hypothetical protein